MSEAAVTPRGWAVPRPSGPLLGLLTLLALFVIILGYQGQLDAFLSARNLLLILHRSSYTAVAALGMLLIIITGGIDLSVGSVMALVGVVTIQTYRELEAGSLAAVAAGLAVGGLCGACNGVVITRLHVSPFVATLGMLSAARGLAIWLSGRTRVGFVGTEPEWVGGLARFRSPTFILNPGVWTVLALAVAVYLLLRYTVLGRYLYAIGSSEPTARLCGVPVGRCKVATYALAGLLTGWAGVILFAHSHGGDPNAAAGLELEVIAAVVIGGASLSGGQGTVTGTLLGVLILGVLENGVTQCNVPPEVKYILIGVIVVANTALSAWQRRE